MTRIGSTLRWDMIIQYRHGFYWVSLFFALVWAGLLSQLSLDGSPNLVRFVPAFLVLNLIITTYYYVGGLVLLEKSEGSLAGIAVSPLRDYEYLAAKVGSLTGLALVESLLIIFIVIGLPQGWIWLALATALLGCFYTLVGFQAIVQYDSINAYIMPSVLVVILLILPLIDHFGLWQHPIFYLHPLQPALVLMRGAFAGPDPWQVIYGVLGSTAWLGLALYRARDRFDHFVVRTAGG